MNDIILVIIFVLLVCAFLWALLDNMKRASAREALRNEDEYMNASRKQRREMENNQLQITNSLWVNDIRVSPEGKIDALVVGQVDCLDTVHADGEALNGVDLYLMIEGNVEAYQRDPLQISLCKDLENGGAECGESFDGYCVTEWYLDIEHKIKPITQKELVKLIELVSEADLNYFTDKFLPPDFDGGELVPINNDDGLEFSGGFNEFYERDGKEISEDEYDDVCLDGIVAGWSPDGTGVLSPLEGPYWRPESERELHFSLHFRSDSDSEYECRDFYLEDKQALIDILKSF